MFEKLTDHYKSAYRTRIGAGKGMFHIVEHFTLFDRQKERALVKAMLFHTCRIVLPRHPLGKPVYPFLRPSSFAPNSRLPPASLHAVTETFLLVVPARTAFFLRLKPRTNASHASCFFSAPERINLTARASWSIPAFDAAAMWLFLEAFSRAMRTVQIAFRSGQMLSANDR